MFQERPSVWNFGYALIKVVEECESFRQNKQQEEGGSQISVRQIQNKLSDVETLLWQAKTILSGFFIF